MTEYWKVKAAYLEYQIRMTEARTHADAAESARAAAFIAAGLDPAKRYKLVDETETITEVESPNET